MNNKINILTVIVSLLMLTGWYYELISPYFLIPIVILYLIINIVGSANIRLNYFFHSHCSSNTTKREITITFDDGPHPVITPKLLDILDSNKITVTFFCTGSNVAEFPEITGNIISKGHIIGNHSYGHSKFFDLLSATKMKSEILRTNQIITSITGKIPVLFRPPYGVTNPMLRKAINLTNMISVGWSLRSLDTVKSSDTVLAKLKTNTNPGDIILFHDTNPHIITIIEDYIIWLQKNDYKIVSLTSLLNINAYED